MARALRVRRGAVVKRYFLYLGLALVAALLFNEVRRPEVRPDPTRVNVNAELRDELAACLRQNDFVTNEKWACDRRVYALREALTSCGIGMDAGAVR